MTGRTEYLMTAKAFTGLGLGVALSFVMVAPCVYASLSVQLGQQRRDAVLPGHPPRGSAVPAAGGRSIAPARTPEQQLPNLDDGVLAELLGDGTGDLDPSMIALARPEATNNARDFRNFGGPKRKRRRVLKQLPGLLDAESKEIWQWLANTNLRRRSAALDRVLGQDQPEDEVEMEFHLLLNNLPTGEKNAVSKALRSRIKRDLDRAESARKSRENDAAQRENDAAQRENDAALIRKLSQEVNDLKAQMSRENQADRIRESSRLTDDLKAHLDAAKTELSRAQALLENMYSLL